MEIRYLKQEEKEASRELYEKCFPEDSEAFTDYYYQYKCQDNHILVMEDREQICSMIHLNPFRMNLYGNICGVHYIVAVATLEEYRRRGYMLELMNRAFHDMYERGEPFTFLIPANPDYYYSCGFEYWDSQIELKQDQDNIWKGQQISTAKESECLELARFSNRVLGQKFDMFIEKDEAYYRRLIKEQSSENGQIVVLREQDGAVSGIFAFDRESGVEIREPIMETGCTEYIHPLMMGRILNLKRFCAMIKSEEPFNMALEIRDGMIPENNGKFRISIDKNGGRAIPMEQGEPEKSLDIARFGKMMFNKMRIYVNEIV